MAKKEDYEDLLREMEQTGSKMSDWDMALAKENPWAGQGLYQAGQAYLKAQSDAQRRAAHDTAEQIRLRYGGYSGGADGSSYLMSERYAPQPQQYQFRYQEQMDALMDQLQNRQAFSYRPQADPSYQAYAQQYRDLGNRAAQNALGDAAALTGGQPSSYSLTASQQAQDSYHARLSDQIPQLQQLAYAMYLDELGQKRSDLAGLMQLDEVGYGRYQDKNRGELERWQLNDQVDRNQRADERYDREWDYQAGRDQLEDQRYDREWDYQTGRDQLADQRYDQEWAYRVDQNRQAKTSGSGQAHTGGGGKSAAAASGAQDYQGLFRAAFESGHPDSFLSNNYKKYGFGSSSGLSADYKAWAKENTYDPGQVGAVAKGLLTDLRKYSSSKQEQLQRVEAEYRGGKGALSREDYLYLLDQLGLLESSGR